MSTTFFGGDFFGGAFFESAPNPPARTVIVGAGGPWQDLVKDRFYKQLGRQLAKAVREEKKLVKEVAKIERTIHAERVQNHPVEGILNKYWKASEKVEAKRAELMKLEIEFKALKFVDDDEDDVEILLLDS